jgi:hypothetical protein
VSIQNAEKLMIDMRGSLSLRSAAYECCDGTAFSGFLASKGYIFVDAEFEDAVNSMRLKARDEAAASEILEIRQWYKMMRGLS